VPLEKIFPRSKFSYLLFSNPTHRTKTGAANRWETTNSKAPGPIIMIDQSETGSSSQIILLRSSLAGVRLCCAFHQPRETKCWAKTILLSQTGMFSLFFIQFECAGSHTEHLGILDFKALKTKTRYKGHK
jgi:hypothetical protein